MMFNDANLLNVFCYFLFKFRSHFAVLRCRLSKAATSSRPYMNHCVAVAYCVGMQTVMAGKLGVFAKVFKYYVFKVLKSFLRFFRYLRF